MILNMIGTDGEPETVIKLKLWPIISLLIMGIVFLGLYVSNHESRLCVTEKGVVEATSSISKVEDKLDKISRDQELYYSLREPRWKEWKAWNEKKNGNGK